MKPETSRLPWEVDHHRQVCLCLFPPRPPRRLPLPGEDPDLNVYLALVQPGHHQATSGAYRTHSVWRGRWRPRRRNPKKNCHFSPSVSLPPAFLGHSGKYGATFGTIDFLSRGNIWAGLLKRNQEIQENSILTGENVQNSVRMIADLQEYCTGLPKSLDIL